MAEWEVVNAAAEDQSVAGWLNAKGLGKYVEKVIELTDAESLEDFKLLNVAWQLESAKITDILHCSRAEEFRLAQAAMVEQIIESVGMKLVTAQKFRQALYELCSIPVEPQEPCQVS